MTDGSFMKRNNPLPPRKKPIGESGLSAVSDHEPLTTGEDPFVGGDALPPLEPGEDRASSNVPETPSEPIEPEAVTPVILPVLPEPSGDKPAPDEGDLSGPDADGGAPSDEAGSGIERGNGSPPADTVVRRIKPPKKTSLDKALASVSSLATRTLPDALRKMPARLRVVSTRAIRTIRGWIHSARTGQKNRTPAGRSAIRIRRTDRERVYKLRGYTTMEKVNAKRKAQRRFKVAQRLLITLMCVGLIGYVAFRKNPFTDVDELLRIIGLRKQVAVAFHQFSFPLVLIDIENAEGTELSPEEDFVQRIMRDGSEDDIFYIQAFDSVSSLKEVLGACRRTISDADTAQLSRDRQIGTVLVLIAKEGNTTNYRFSDVRQSGVVIDITAAGISATGGESRVYIVGLLSDNQYLGYSFDVTDQTGGGGAASKP